MTRRRFMRNTIYTIANVVAAVLAYPAIRYFICPATGKQAPEASTAIASLTEFAIGMPTFMTYGEGVQDGWTAETMNKGARIVYNGGNDVVVFDPHCTHLGCGYSWHADKRQFLCP